jgi:hypothetical protein
MNGHLNLITRHTRPIGLPDLSDWLPGIAYGSIMA